MTFLTHASSMKTVSKLNWFSSCVDLFSELYSSQWIQSSFSLVQCSVFIVYYSCFIWHCQCPPACPWYKMIIIIKISVWILIKRKMTNYQDSCNKSLHWIQSTALQKCTFCILLDIRRPISRTRHMVQGRNHQKASPLT